MLALATLLRDGENSLSLINQVMMRRVHTLNAGDNVVRRIGEMLGAVSATPISSHTPSESIHMGV